MNSLQWPLVKRCALLSFVLISIISLLGWILERATLHEQVRTLADEILRLKQSDPGSARDPDETTAAVEPVMSRATSPEAIEPPIGLVEGPFRIATDDQAMIEWPRATLTRVWKIANREDASQESKEEWLQRQFGEKKILYFHIDGTNYYLWIVDGIVMPVVSGLHEIWQIEGVDHLFKNMSSVSSTAKRVTLHAQGGDVAYVVELDFTRGCEISSHRVFSGP